MERKILFRTIHGSRLYGLAHEGSDYDWYTVIDKPRTKKAKYATHSIVGSQDSNVVDFGTWVNFCQKGVPQALEAMFSQQAEIDHIPDFRAQFVGGNAFDGYLGIMKSIKFEHADSYKHKRHIIRLALNMRDLREFGRFDPTLKGDNLELVNELAKLPMKYVYADALAIALS